GNGSDPCTAWNDGNGNHLFSYLCVKVASTPSTVRFVMGDYSNGLDRFSFNMGNSTAIARTGGTWTTGTPDIAENIKNADGAEAGDILSADSTASESATKASIPYDPTILGAVSTHPGFMMTGDIGTEDITNAPSLSPQGF